jgi:hypothetical protein
MEPTDQPAIDALEAETFTDEPSWDNITGDDARNKEHAPQNFYKTFCDCFKCTAGVTWLFIVNVLVSGLLMYTADTLDVLKSLDLKEEHREIILIILSSVLTLLTNLGTLYFYFTRTRRHSMAVNAVFCCCKRNKKEYKEAIVPYMDVLRQIGKESKVSFAQVVFGLLLLLVEFAISFLLVSHMYASAAKDLLILFSLAALALWACVVKIVLKSKSFLPPSSEESNENISLEEPVPELTDQETLKSDVGSITSE